MEELLGCKEIDLGFVVWTAQNLEREYNYVLSYFYDAMEKDFKGDILVVIKNTVSILCDKITWIIHNINDYNGRKKKANRTN
jgi:hypothetical protein